MLASEMVTEVRDHGFDDLTESRILSFLNDAYFDICAREPWPFLEATATLTINASGLVTSPTNVTSVLNVYDSSQGGSLQPQRLDDISDLYGQDLTLTGAQARHYYFIGGSMYIYPVPSNTIKMNYISFPEALTTSPDTEPVLPTHAHRLLVTGALAKASVMEDDPDLAAVYTNMFETRLSQARSAMWMRQYDRPDNIQDVFWEDDFDEVY
jgi:hypothetical protein